MAQEPDLRTGFVSGRTHRGFPPSGKRPDARPALSRLARSERAPVVAAQDSVSPLLCGHAGSNSRPRDLACAAWSWSSSSRSLGQVIRASLRFIPFRLTIYTVDIHRVYALFLPRFRKKRMKV